MYKRQPFKQAEFDILYGQGISIEGGLIDMGVEHGIVKKSGAWFTYEGDQLGQGKENSRRFLKDNPELAQEIERKILVKLGISEDPDQASQDVEGLGDDSQDLDPDAPFAPAKNETELPAF